MDLFWCMVLEGSVPGLWPCALRKNIVAAGTYDRAVSSHLCDQEAEERQEEAKDQLPPINYP